MTAFQAEGCGLPLRAMLIKSALRIYLSVSYVMISILRIGSLRSPPPFRLRHWTHLRREGSEGAVPHSDCPTVCGAERWWRQPPKGENTEMVPEVYDSLFFPSYLSFPLEGKSREAGKGVRGRAPIGGSIAVLTANRRPPERSDARNVVSRFPFRAIRHRIKIS